MSGTIINSGIAPGVSQKKFFGKYRGTVTQIDDPKQIGRLRARVSAVLGDTETSWALPCMPYGGNGVGLFNVPPVGAGVWVEFEGGDPSSPIWTGCWWAEGQSPHDIRHQAGQRDVHLWRTDSGLMVVLDEGGKTVRVSDATGANMLRIDMQTGHVRLAAQTRVVVEAPQVELGTGAVQPVPLGVPLLAYLNVLATGLNSMGVAVPPATPELLSSSTKTA